MLFIFVLFEHHISPAQQGITSVALLLTLINVGAIMQQKKW
jgi:alkylglycerol monooxygenase